MYRFHIDTKTAALALALSGLAGIGMTVPAVAATDAMPATTMSHPAMSHPAAKAEMATKMKMGAKDTMATKGKMAMKMKAAAGDDAMSHSPATDALNLLESKGYGDFSNFHRAGRMYAATVSRDGKTMHLTIDPEAGTIEKRDS